MDIYKIWFLSILYFLFYDIISSIYIFNQSITFISIILYVIWKVPFSSLITFLTIVLANLYVISTIIEMTMEIIKCLLNI